MGRKPYFMPGKLTKTGCRNAIPSIPNLSNWKNLWKYPVMPAPKECSEKKTAPLNIARQGSTSRKITPILARKKRSPRWSVSSVRQALIAKRFGKWRTTSLTRSQNGFQCTSAALWLPLEATQSVNWRRGSGCPIWSHSRLGRDSQRACAFHWAENWTLPVKMTAR